MVRYFYVLVTLIACSSSSSAQDCVSSGTYNLMLKGLLEHNVPTLCVDSAKVLQTAVFLDAREKEEFEVSSIQGAMPVGYDDFKIRHLKDLPQDTLIVVYCSVGYRSEKVTQKLLKAGYSNVYNLYGGIFEWVNQGNPTYHEEKVTLKIHAYDRIWGQWLEKGEKVY